MSTKPEASGVVSTIISSNCLEHIKWLKTVFEAEQYELYMSDDTKRVLHCVLGLNGGLLYISDSMTEEFSSTTADEEPSGFMLNLEMENPSDVWNRATSNSASVVLELKVQECGNLCGSFKDPYGFTWNLIKMEADQRKPGVTPYILCDGDCEEHIQWILSAFDGEVKTKVMKGQSVQHCAIKVNNSSIYMADGSTYPPMMHLAESGKITCLMCHLDLPDPYPLYEKLLKLGATSTIELKVQFWGGTYGAVRDVKGLEWSLSKSPPKEEMPSSAGVTPYIVSRDCNKHIEWIQKVFAGEVKEVFRTPAKKIMHCRIAINGGKLFLCDGSCGPDKDKMTEENYSEGVVLHMILEDPDVVWKNAMAYGSEQVTELKRQYWGGYYGCFRDPLGVKWGIIKRCE